MCVYIYIYIYIYIYKVSMKVIVLGFYDFKKLITKALIKKKKKKKVEFFKIWDDCIYP